MTGARSLSGTTVGTPSGASTIVLPGERLCGSAIGGMLMLTPPTSRGEIAPRGGGNFEPASQSSLRHLPQKGEWMQDVRQTGSWSQNSYSSAERLALSLRPQTLTQPANVARETHSPPSAVQIAASPLCKQRHVFNATAHNPAASALETAA